ncbi:MAG: NADH-quinone oxidoreductase subunit I [Bacteroidetes bacterium]|nr:NADH-quinone oxidoreductase subunit I [Bacteroidota bacterium]
MSGYFKDIYAGISTALVGMRITWNHLFVKNVTIQYPDEKHDIPERVRNRLYVNMDDCIGCDQCAKACPVNCITIETAKALPDEELGETSTGNRKRLWVTQFDIDIAKCCFCGLCVPPCPTVCIFMTPVFEFSEYNREDLIYRFSTLTAEEGAVKTANAERAKQEAEAKKAAEMEAKKKAAAEKAAAEKAAAEKAAAEKPADEPSTAPDQSDAPATGTAPTQSETPTPDNNG